MEQKKYVDPLTGMTPCFITLDVLGLKYSYKGSPIKLIDLIKKAEKLCPNKELGRSFKTDSTHAIIQFIQVVPITLDENQKGAGKR